jgi:hypothetical protein
MFRRAHCGNQPGALAESGKSLGVRSFYSGDPDVTCSTLSSYSCAMHTVLADPLTWQTHLPNAMADNASLYPNAVLMRYWRELHVEKPAETQTSLRLASHLVKAPKS